MIVLQGPFSGEPAGEAGWTTVMEDGSGEYRMAVGEPLGFWEWLFGKRRFYQVFTAPHRVEFAYDLQSKQSTYKFVARVSATAEVRDAVAAARQGLCNTSDALRQPVQEALQHAVRLIEFRETDKAWEEGAAALRQVGHSLIHLSNTVLTIETDPDAREPIRTIEAKPLDIEAYEAHAEIQEIKRRDLLQDFNSLDAMLVRVVTETDPQTRAALNHAITLKMRRDGQLIAREIERFRYRVAAGEIEEHEIAAALGKVLEQIEHAHGGKVPPAAFLGSGAQENDADGGKSD